jgi:hypothetical protein
MERQNLEVGQKVYLYYGGYGRNFEGRYSMPLPIIKVTKTQFTVAAENMNSKPKRFMKSNGREVGRGYSRSSPSVTLVTSASSREVNKHNAEVKAKARKKDNDAFQAEAALREKYGATLVSDDDIQNRFLKPLRTMAEAAEHEMGELFRAFDGVSLEAENFYRVTDAVERETRNGSFAFGLKARDYAREQHQRFVNTIEEFSTGTRYTVDKTEVTDLEELLTAQALRALRDQMNRFFGYTFSNQDATEADQKFIAVLREMVQEDYAHPIVKIKEEGEDNA